MRPETRGAKLLDKVRPNWFRKVAVRRLEMGSCKDCILGQVYGDFDEGLDRLDVWGAYYEHGFNSNADAEKWAELIAARRKAMRA